MAKQFPDPSQAVADWMLHGFTYGEKTQIRRARKEWLAANKEAVEAEKAKHARTCQICARPIFAETGVIAHHGYTRPFEGYQTASCFGARALSFEKSRDTLGEWIDKVTMYADNARFLAAKIRAGKTAVPISWKSTVRGPRGKSIDVPKTFWAATEEEYKWAYGMKLAATNRYHYYFKEKDLVSFEQAREQYAKNADATFADWESERVAQQARYDAWVQLEE